MTTTVSTPSPTGAVIHECAGFSGETALGGGFAIYGAHFGNIPQPVTIGGREVKVTSWRSHTIRGVIPFDFPSGPATVEVAGASIETVILP